MTNILASIVITLVTNVSERFPQHFVNLSPTSWNTLEYIGKYVDVPNPSVKWVKTTVTKVTKVSFEWNGKVMEINDCEVVSEVEVEMRRQDAWTAVATNDVQKGVYMTNNHMNITNMAWK